MRKAHVDPFLISSATSSAPKPFSNSVDKLKGQTVPIHTVFSMYNTHYVKYMCVHCTPLASLKLLVSVKPMKSCACFI